MPLETSPRASGAGAPDHPGDRSVGRAGSARSGSRARSRRSAVAAGTNTVFLTLRDTVADISIRSRAPRGHRRRCPPRWSRAPGSSCHAKPSFYANRGTLSLNARDIRPVGRGRAARPARTATAAARRRGPVRRGAASARSRSCRATSGWSRPRTRPPSATSSRTPGGAGRASQFTVRYAAIQGMHAAGEVIEAVQSLDRDEAVDVIVDRPGRWLGRGPAAVLRRGAGPRRREIRTPLVSAIGHEPDSPLLDLVADVRASTPTDAAKLVVPDVAEEAHRVLQARERGRMAIRSMIDRELHQLGHSSPGRAWRTRARASTSATARSTA